MNVSISGAGNKNKKEKGKAGNTATEGFTVTKKKLLRRKVKQILKKRFFFFSLLVIVRFLYLIEIKSYAKGDNKWFFSKLRF